MLKIRSQLNRALSYQTVLGTERVTNHFDDSAKDLAGPPSKAPYREPLRERTVQPIGSTVNNMRARRDPVTNSWVGYYAEREG